MTTINYCATAANDHDYRRPIKIGWFSPARTRLSALRRTAVRGSPFASEPSYQALREEKKINAGAQFFQTNLIYDPEGLDLWLEALPDMKFIGTFRHPYRVALSLNNRDDTPIETGMELWRQYNERLIELHGKAAFDIVDFDAEPQDYLDDVIGKMVRLGVTPSRAEEARDFFDTSLRNQTGVSIDDYDLPLQIELTYKKLQDIYMGSGGTISPGGNG